MERSINPLVTIFDAVITCTPTIHLFINMYHSLGNLVTQKSIVHVVGLPVVINSDTNLNYTALSKTIKLRHRIVQRQKNGSIFMGTTTSLFINIYHTLTKRPIKWMGLQSRLYKGTIAEGIDSTDFIIIDLSI